MAIAVDGTSASPGTYSGASSYKWAHTIGAGLTNSALFVGIQDRDLTSVGNGSVNSISFAGTNLTQAVLKQDSTDGLWSGIYYLLSPPAGLGTVTVTLKGTCTAQTGGAISLSGVHQTTPTNGTTAGTGQAQSSAAGTITTTIDGDYFISSLYQKSGFASTDGAGQTRIFQLFPVSAGGTTGDGSGDTSNMSYKSQATHGAGTMSYSWSPADDMAISVVAVRPAATTTTVLGPAWKTLLGVGQI